ncbi:GNAT family N-acetyltransferase [Desulfosporosinus sp. BICA1-9]|uniref:GNAT family N-acetyltransferase n=1 Tax=Desulfosporosinus sp. BICA1-9 TaxID=1531958 RepID=UPI000AE48C96|nr:GNAT family N-acetyltransferase [Desulfosporosinus sp. BICA1-9]
MLSRELVDNKSLIADLWETERLIIRDANLLDVDSLQEIYIQSQSAEGWTRDHEVTTDYILNGVKQGNLPPNGMKEFYKIQLITLKDSARIVGFIEFYHGYPDKEVLYIATLLFCEDCRNNGYGQEVINKLCEQALELGFRQARLGVTLRNWSGLYFWTKLGFNTILKYHGDKVLAKDSFALLVLGKTL